MTVVGDNELIISSVLIFPCLDIERRNFVGIPEISIHAIVDHLNFFVRNPVNQPEGIHGIIGYAVIDVIGEPENNLFKKFV